MLAGIAQHGYVLIASQLRSTYGSEGKDEFGGADTLDVISCIPALAQLPKADTSRLGLYGISWGGLNALQLLRSERYIRAAIVNSRVLGAFAALQRPGGEGFEQEVYARLIPNYRRDKQRQLALSSPFYWPEKICKTTPLLIMQGSADWRTDAALALAQKLYALKCLARFVLMESGAHGLRGDPLRDYLLFDWLDRYVRDRAPLPDLMPQQVKP